MQRQKKIEKEISPKAFRSEKLTYKISPKIKINAKLNIL
jgi:hypothetical protein